MKTDNDLNLKAEGFYYVSRCGYGLLLTNGVDFYKAPAPSDWVGATLVQHWFKNCPTHENILK